MRDVKRWQGLSALLGEAIEHGTKAIQRVHLETAGRSFAILEQVPGISEPAQIVHQLHDGIVGNVYVTIRLVNHALGTLLESSLLALDAAAESEAEARARELRDQPPSN